MISPRRLALFMFHPLPVCGWWETGKLKYEQNGERALKWCTYHCCAEILVVAGIFRVSCEPYQFFLRLFIFWLANNGQAEAPQQRYTTTRSHGISADRLRRFVGGKPNSQSCYVSFNHSSTPSSCSLPNEHRIAPLHSLALLLLLYIGGDAAIIPPAAVLCCAAAVDTIPRPAASLWVVTTLLLGALLSSPYTSYQSDGKTW